MLDLGALEKLRQALWSNGSEGRGRAIAMVGAGFSRNADPVSLVTGRFPDWGDLSLSMLQDLQLELDDTELAGLPRPDVSGFLRIAEEYDAVFRRRALNAKIKAMVPNDTFAPGDLHRDMLRLPWRNVLTTNWDTLIERGAAKFTPNTYSIVAQMGDIPSEPEPRIVKLHGCIERNPDFTITEEDFRTYQNTRSPFVNLVRQSMLENVSCLLGFSGEDPNFLNWSGWRRDVLGKLAPPVYLVGLLNLTRGRREMLNTLNVKTIDLSEMFDPDSDRAPERHRKALRWFFNQLELGRPYTLTSWPEPRSNRQDADETFQGLRPPAGPVEEPSEAVDHEGDGEDGDPEPALRLQPVIEKWAHNRELYPNWIVAPRDTRQTIYRQTHSWLLQFEPHHEFESAELYGFVFESLNKLLSGETRTNDAFKRAHLAIRFLYELTWRLDCALCRYPKRLNEVLDLALERAPSDGKGDSASERPFELLELFRAHLADASSKLDVEISKVRSTIVHLGARRLVSARRALELNVLEDLLRDLRGVNGSVDPEIENLLDFELSLKCLAEGRYTHLVAQSSNVLKRGGDPFWIVRHASLLAEVGRLEQALDWYLTALQRLRVLRLDDHNELAVASREVWALQAINRVLAPLEKMRKPTEPAIDIPHEVYDPAHKRKLENACRCRPEEEREWLLMARDVGAGRQGRGMGGLHVLFAPPATEAALFLSEETGYPQIRSTNKTLCDTARQLIPTSPQIALEYISRGNLSFVRWLSQPEDWDGDGHTPETSDALGLADARRFASLPSREASQALIRQITACEALLADLSSSDRNMREEIIESLRVRLNLCSLLVRSANVEAVSRMLCFAITIYKENEREFCRKTGPSLVAVFRSVFRKVNSPNAQRFVRRFLVFALHITPIPVGNSHLETLPEPAQYVPKQHLSRLIKDNKSVRAFRDKLLKQVNKRSFNRGLRHLHDRASSADAHERNGALHRLNLLCQLGFHDLLDSSFGRSYLDQVRDAFGDVQTTSSFDPTDWLGLELSASDRPKRKRSKGKRATAAEEAEQLEMAEAAFVTLRTNFIASYVTVEDDLTWTTLRPLTRALSRYGAPPGAEPMLRLNPDDAQTLFKRLQAWSNSEESLSKRPMAVVGRNQVSHLLHDAILELVDEKTPTEHLDEYLSFVLHLHSEEYPVDRCLARLIGHVDQRDLKSRLADSLHSGNPSRCAAAVDAILEWLRQSQESKDVGAPDVGLLNDLLITFKSADRDVSLAALQALIQWSEATGVDQWSPSERTRLVHAIARKQNGLVPNANSDMHSTGDIQLVMEQVRRLLGELDQFGEVKQKTMDAARRAVDGASPPN